MKLSETLVLLRPEDLTSNYQLGESRDKLCKVLSMLQQALAETSYQQALIIVNQALEILGSLNVISTEEKFSTNTSLDPWKIDDYDNFFCLEHKQVEEPAKCLVMSVLIAYQALLKFNLCTALEISTREKLEIQKSGFRSCVNLLIRAFNLSLEDYHD
ncbi:MAG: hypothetical protein LDL41_04970 [Coleofasciculus sp. S288]|nr:hypothetical protein [Coleofasciculus sp. S288]